MSQLSFAIFFDQAKEAAPVIPVKPALPAVNVQAIPHRMMTIEDARRQFVAVFMDTARNLRRWEVFSDFITLAASELDLTSSPTFALRVSGGRFPLLGDSCSRSTGFLLHRAA